MRGVQSGNNVVCAQRVTHIERVARDQVAYITRRAKCSTVMAYPRACRGAHTYTPDATGSERRELEKGQRSHAHARAIVSFLSPLRRDFLID
jgi:hypothetical protein